MVHLIVPMNVFMYFVLTTMKKGKIIYIMCKEYCFLRFILMRFWFYI